MAMSSGVLPSCPRKPLRAITSAWPSCNIQQRGAAVRGLAVDIRADYLHTRWPTFNLADTLLIGGMLLLAAALPHAYRQKGVL